MLEFSNGDLLKTRASRADFRHADSTMIWLDKVSILILTFLVITVAVFDLRERRIPNFLVFPAAVIGLVLHSIGYGLHGFLFSLKGLGLGFALLLIPYLVKGMKAGDV